MQYHLCGVIINGLLLANNPVYHAKIKHVELDIHFIKVEVLAKQLDICFVPNADQTANILTKAFPYGNFHYLRCKLNVLLGTFCFKGDVRVCGNADAEIIGHDWKAW